MTLKRYLPRAFVRVLPNVTHLPLTNRCRFTSTLRLPGVTLPVNRTFCPVKATMELFTLTAARTLVRTVALRAALRVPVLETLIRNELVFLGAWLNTT